VITTEAPQLPGVVINIRKVTDAAPGKKMTIEFSVFDKKGNAIPMSKMDRMSFRIAGSTTDFTTQLTETATAATGANGIYTWTCTNALPANAVGTWSITAEGRTLITLLPGTAKQVQVRDSAKNAFMDVSVDGSKLAARRQVVSTEKCNACHGNISFHGGSRNETRNCVFCHNPTAAAGTGAAAVSINFPVMIHKIHSGEELSRGYKIGTADFAEVGYPGDRRACSQCHVNNSEQLPLGTSLSKVNTPNEPLNPTMPTAAACGGCHDSVSAASHFLTNTNAVGESCAVCHGRNAEFSVNKSHAR
jgi:OmcA/MtrC family decaheme c-type cytochrome